MRPESSLRSGKDLHPVKKLGRHALARTGNREETLADGKGNAAFLGGGAKRKKNGAEMSKEASHRKARDKHPAEETRPAKKNLNLCIVSDKHRNILGVRKKNCSRHYSKMLNLSPRVKSFGTMTRGREKEAIVTR